MSAASTPRRSGLYLGGGIEPPFRVTSPRRIHDDSPRRFLDPTVSRPISRSPTKVSSRAQDLSRSYDSFDKIPKRSLSAGIAHSRSQFRRDSSRNGSAVQSPSLINQTVLDDAAWMSERIYNLQKNGFFRYPAVSKLAIDRGASQPVTPRSDDYGRRSLWPSQASDYSRDQDRTECDAENDELLSAFKLSEVSLAGDDDLLSDISSCTDFYTSCCPRPDIAVQCGRRVGDVASQSSTFQSPSCSTPNVGNENDNSGSFTNSSDLDRANSTFSPECVSSARINSVRGDLLSRLEALQYRAGLAVKESEEVDSIKIGKSETESELAFAESKRAQKSTELRSGTATPTSQLSQLTEGLSASMNSSEWPPRTPPKQPSHMFSRTIRPEYYLPLSSEEAFDEPVFETKDGSFSSPSAGKNWSDSKDGNRPKSPKPKICASLEQHGSHQVLEQIKDLKNDQRTKSKHASPNQKLSRRVKPAVASSRSPHSPRTGVILPPTPGPDGKTDDQSSRRLRASSQNPDVHLTQSTDILYQNVRSAVGALNMQGNDRSIRSAYSESHPQYEDENSWISEENVESFLSNHMLAVKNADSLMSAPKSVGPVNNAPTIEATRKDNSDIDVTNNIKSHAHPGNLRPLTFSEEELKEMSKPDDGNSERIQQPDKPVIEKKSMQNMPKMNVDECSTNKDKRSSNIAKHVVSNDLTSESSTMLSTPIENNAISHDLLLASEKSRQIANQQGFRETIISGATLASIALQGDVPVKRNCFRETTSLQADRPFHSNGSLGIEGNEQKTKVMNETRADQENMFMEPKQSQEQTQLSCGYSIESSCSTHTNEDTIMMHSTSEIVSIYGNPLWIDDSDQAPQDQQILPDLSSLNVETHVMERTKASLSFPKRSLDNVWNTYEGVAGFLNAVADSSDSHHIVSSVDVDHASLNSTVSSRLPKDSENCRELKEMALKDAGNPFEENLPVFSTLEVKLRGPLVRLENPLRGSAIESQRENGPSYETSGCTETDDNLESSKQPECDSYKVITNCLDDENKSSSFQMTDAKQRHLVNQTSGHSFSYANESDEQNGASDIREEVKQVTFIFPESKSAKEVPKNVETSNSREDPVELSSCLVWSFFSNARKLGCDCQKDQEAKVEKIEKRVHDLEAEVEKFRDENNKLQKLLKCVTRKWKHRGFDASNKGFGFIIWRKINRSGVSSKL